jgi:hypothetical protein
VFQTKVSAKMLLQLTQTRRTNQLARRTSVVNQLADSPF